jgi:two-component system sensor histidine kinase KdpD
MDESERTPAGNLPLHLGGRLKLFLGAAPGVGKTFTMLREARLTQEKGADVVIGFLDTHGRPATAREAEGLEMMPRLKIPVQGRIFEEVDLDGILARRPEVVVIDELAHTNAPGSRFPKRYQDVIWLLDQGIHVLTAVNIQHLEHVAPEVEAITGTRVREIIPQSFVKRANEIAVVDVSPEALRRRLRDGDIYPPEQVRSALDNFFKTTNLSALRELVLREVADDVDAWLQQSYERQKIPGPVGARETILVCLNYRERAPKLLARGQRMAERLKAGFYVLTVVGMAPDLLTAAEQHNLKLLEANAHAAGAEFIAEPRNDRPIGEVILEVANRVGATQIVIGQPKATGVASLLKDNPVRYLLSHMEYVDLRIVGWQE